MVLLSSGQQFENNSENNNDEQVQTPRGLREIDYLGIGAFILTITSLLAAAELFGKGRPGIRTSAILMVVALCSALLFLLIEAYHAKEPLIPLTLLKTVMGIHFLVQILLFLGRQAVFHLFALDRRSEGSSILTCVHSIYQASPRIFLGHKTSTRRVLHCALYRRR